MLFQVTHEDRLGRLKEQLQHAPVVTSDLMRELIAETCVRLSVLRDAGKEPRVDRLIEAGAWTEAALAMVEIELPLWKVRRLVFEGGEWLCSLSRQPNLPIAYDEAAEARHHLLPLAILSAFLEARERIAAPRPIGLQTVPRVRSISGHVVCCDDFA
jgi:hypothetical protein